MTLGERIVVMKDAQIHQVGTPLEVYGRPVNLFVAGFVGTPPMNMLNGKVIRREQGFYFDEGQTQIRLPERLNDPLRDHVDKDVVMGIRPEAMNLYAQGRFAGQENILPLTANVIEPLGEKMDLYCSTQHHPHIIARVDAEVGLEPGQSVELHLDLNRAHLFEPGEAGRNLEM